MEKFLKIRICYIYGLMKAEHIFVSLVDIPSYPEEFLGLRDFIMFSLSLVDMDFRLIFEKGFLKDCIK